VKRQNAGTSGPSKNTHGGEKTPCTRMFQSPVAIGSVAAWGQPCRLANEIGDKADKTSANVTGAPSWSRFNDVFALSLTVPNNVIVF
jgi:hypothetical protein